jgi:hypothetical protein
MAGGILWSIAAKSLMGFHRLVGAVTLHDHRTKPQEGERARNSDLDAIKA